MSFFYIVVIGQSSDNISIVNLKSESVIIESNYPDVELKSWDRNEIKIESAVTINGEDHNGAYILETKNTSTGVYVDVKVDTKSLNKKVVVNNEDGSKSYFDFKGFDNLNFGENDNVSMNIGYNIEAKVVIWLPERMKVKVATVYGDIQTTGSFAHLVINSIYGMIEAELMAVNKMNKLELKSTYDIIDLTINPKIEADLKMSSSYGEMYSDLKLSSKSETSNNQCGSTQNFVMNGGGMEINLMSTYDNIYVRSRKSL